MVTGHQITYQLDTFSCAHMSICSIQACRKQFWIGAARLGDAYAIDRV